MKLKKTFFEWVLNYQIESLSGAALFEAHDPNLFYKHYFEYIFENSVYFRAFNDSSIWPQFSLVLKQNGVEIFQKFISKNTTNKNLSYLISNYAVSAHIGVVTSWLNATPLVPPTNIATIVTEMTNAALESQGFSLAELFSADN